MSLDFEEFDVPVDGKSARILVVTPAVHVVATRERLADEGIGELTELDLSIRDRIRQGADRLTGFVFRGRQPDGSGSWTFDESLTLNERTRIAFQMFHAHLRLNRLMVRLGITAHFYTDWEEHELEAFVAATEQLAANTREEGPLRPVPDTLDAARRRLDLWICANFTFYAALPLEVAIRSVLPMRLQRMAAQRERLNAMCEPVDQAIFDI